MSIVTNFKFFDGVEKLFDGGANNLRRSKSVNIIQEDSFEE